MSVQQYSYDHFKSVISKLPKITTRPDVDSIRGLQMHGVVRAMKFPTTQSQLMGYSGLLLQPAIYNLSEPTPWQDTPDPRRNFELPPNIFLTATEMSNSKCRFDQDKLERTNQENFKRAMRDAVDKAIPNEYKPGQGVGVRGFGTMTLAEIFAYIYQNYGIVSPMELQKLSRQLDQKWNPNEPIESLFKNIEDIALFAIVADKPFQTHTLITAGKCDEMREYNRLNPTGDEEWTVFKTFWKNAYTDFDRDRQTMASAGYHSANNAVNNPPGGNDDDSLSSLHTAFNSVMAGVTAKQSEQNTNIEDICQRLAIYEQEIASLRQERDMHRANAATSQPPPSFTMPTQYAPQFQPMTAPPMPPPMQYQPYQGPPPSYNYQHNNNNGGRGGRGGGGRYNNGGGRGGNYNGNSNNRGSNNQCNPVRRHENNFYCYTHGFDVDHPGSTCAQPRFGHMPNVTGEQVRTDSQRGPSKEYWLMPHACHSGMHKHIMPSQAHLHGYNVPPPIRNNNRRGRNNNNNNGGGYIGGYSNNYNNNNYGNNNYGGNNYSSNGYCNGRFGGYGNA